jgi:hypothetical protein
LAPLFFVLCIGDLPEIVNSQSGLILSACGKIINIAHSKLVYFQNVVHDIFASITNALKPTNWH